MRNSQSNRRPATADSDEQPQGPNQWRKLIYDVQVGASRVADEGGSPRGVSLNGA